MRKKQLLEQNISLFDKLQDANAEIVRLNSERKKLEEKNKSLKSSGKNAEQPSTSLEPPIERLKERIIERHKLSEDVEYGSAVIGKIVVEAAKNCNILSLRHNEQAKELINLILGKTEVAKSEILKIVSSDKEYSEKQRLIDAQYVAACEYFVGILGQ